MSKRVASPGRHSSNKAARLSSSSSSSKATNSKLLELERENKELREKLTKYEANEIAKKAEEEANKPTYPCCRHIDSSHETKLQPDGSAYCDNCESTNSCVHATGLDSITGYWNCLEEGCQSQSCSYMGWQWTMFCGDCLNERKWRQREDHGLGCWDCDDEQKLYPDEACDRYIYKPLSDDGCCAPCQARRDQEEAEEAAEQAREEAEEAAELGRSYRDFKSQKYIQFELPREESTSSTSGSKPVSITEE